MLAAEGSESGGGGRGGGGVVGFGCRLMSLQAAQAVEAVEAWRIPSRLCSVTERRLFAANWNYLPSLAGV